MAGYRCRAIDSLRGHARHARRGDLKPHPAVGRWAGDRVALVGDYARDGDLPKRFKASTISKRCDEGKWKDVSELVCDVIEKEFDGKFMGQAPECKHADGSVSHPAAKNVHRGEGWREWKEND